MCSYASVQRLRADLCRIGSTGASTVLELLRVPGKLWPTPSSGTSLIDHVFDALTRSDEPVSVDDNLLGQVLLIMEKGVVLGRAKGRTIQGIVTRELSQQFADLASPYFIFEETEQRLRRKINETLSGEEIAAAKDDADSDREVKSAADLTLGECAGLLEVRARWDKVERTIFIDLLHKVCKVHNEVMHFGVAPGTRAAHRSGGPRPTAQEVGARLMSGRYRSTGLLNASNRTEPAQCRFSSSAMRSLNLATASCMTFNVGSRAISLFSALGGSC